MIPKSGHQTPGQYYLAALGETAMLIVERILAILSMPLELFTCRRFGSSYFSPIGMWTPLVPWGAVFLVKFFRHSHTGEIPGMGIYLLFGTLIFCVTIAHQIHGTHRRYLGEGIMERGLHTGTPWLIEHWLHRMPYGSHEYVRKGIGLTIVFLPIMALSYFIDDGVFMVCALATLANPIRWRMRYRRHDAIAMSWIDSQYEMLEIRHLHNKIVRGRNARTTVGATAKSYMVTIAQPVPGSKPRSEEGSASG